MNDVFLSALSDIRRCVAVGGDVLHIRNGQLYVNGELAMVPGGSQTEYVVVTNKKPYDIDFLKEELDIDLDDTKGQLEMLSDSSFKFNVTPEELAKLRKLPNFVSDSPYTENYIGMTFPADEANYPWTMDHKLSPTSYLHL